MANQEHLDILKQGIKVWNNWRKEHPYLLPDLYRAELSGANLKNINLRDANLREAFLYGADLHEANLIGANLYQANLHQANLYHTELKEAHLERAHLWLANFSKANLTKAILSSASLYKANFSDADLRGANLVLADLSYANFWNANLAGANLRGANLSKGKFQEANLTRCLIHGVSAWDVELDGATQLDLVITDEGEPTITLDNIEFAQFAYLLLNNQKIRNAIDTIGQKGVLILGRFSKERKPVLDALREKLRLLNFLPMVFDFERPTQRDFTETIMTLACLCRFIIADITNPKSSPLELQATIPNYMIPFVPIIQEGEEPFAMFQDLQRKHNWVLDPLVYDTPSRLISVLEKAIIEPALVKHKELMMQKVKQLSTRHVKDYS